MNKKVLIGIIAVILIAGITVGCIFFFNKKENTQNNNNTNNNAVEPTNNIMSIAQKDFKLIVAFTEDGKEISLLDISNYRDVVYSVDNNKLYLFMSKQATPSDIKSLGYIDFNDKEYRYIELANNIETPGYPVSIAVYDNDIYYTTSNSNYIFKYNIETKETTKPTNMQMQYATVLKSTNNKMIYMTAGTVNTKSKYGIIDLTTGDKKELNEDVYVEYTYGNKVIYLKYEDGQSNKWKYYEYDVDTEKTRVISDEAEGIQSVYDSYIVPYEDYYVYVCENHIYKYSNGKADLLKDADDWINYFVLLSKEDIHIIYGYSEDMDVTAIYKTYNIKNNTYTDSTNKAEYSKVLYVK